MTLIEPMDYVVRFIDLPPRIHAFTSIDEDGRANIYINRRMNSAAHRGSFLHEINHLQRNDYFSDRDIRFIENA